MAERLAGIQVHEEASAQLPIAEAPTAITAFVGRCLRGPVNRPVTLTGFAEFQRVFGGLWQPSTLSYAVEQYFENGGRTAIVVSHRVSTIRDADQIVVLHEGRVAERGTHDELIRRDGLYADLYRKQLLEEELKAS